MDDSLWLKVRMPAADLGGFLEDSPFQSVTLATNDDYYIPMFEGFLSEPPSRFRAGDQSLPNGRHLNVVIDESDATNVVVYLMWHET